MCEHLTCPGGTPPGDPAVPDRRAFVQGATACLAALFLAAGFDVPVDARELTGEAQGVERRYPIPPSDGVTVDRGGQLLLVRLHGQVFALALACPHQQAVVRWNAGDARFQCSKHDSRYDPTGIHTAGRATRNMDRFPIRRDGDAVVVDAAHVFRSDQDAAGWAAAVVSV